MDAEHPGQLGGQVVERAVGRDREIVLDHLLPVRPRHDDHPAKPPPPAQGGRTLRSFDDPTLTQRAVPDRTGAQPHRPRRRGRRLAAAVAGGLADHRGPFVRGSGAVAARPGGSGASGRAAQMRPDDRPDGVRRRHRRHLHPGRSPAAAGRGVQPGSAGPRGRPGVARRRAGAGRDDPGAPRRPGDRGDRPQHQPARRAHPQPAGAVLPAGGGRPDPDDRAAATSRRRGSAATTPTHPGWATGSSGSTSRARRLREPERAVGLPAARASTATWPGWSWPT